MKKYLTEFIGMFFFVLAVGCAVIGNSIGALAQQRRFQIVPRESACTSS